MNSIIATLFLLPSLTWGLIGYDCGAGSLNISTISTLDIEDCPIITSNVNVTKRYVQLLQINEFTNARVIQCKLEIHRTIYDCGMFSHNSIVGGGEHEYIYEISRDKCKQAHETGILNFNNHVISGLRVNYTSTHPMIFAGSIKQDGKCDGAGYSDSYGTWESVIVQGTLKITLKEHIGTVKLNDDKIQLRSGTRCTLSDLSCVDNEGGYTFWDIIPSDRCEFFKYGLLYEGFANKIFDSTPNFEQTVYSLSTESVTFSLIAKGKLNVCGYELTKTEHPKLLIFETVKGISFARGNEIAVENLDLFAYMNSKFVFVERHIKTQIRRLYEDIVNQRCKEERRILKNALAIATQSPVQFAYNLMKGPGYMAIAAGEVVHVIKCIPVEVKIAHSGKCYEELTVYSNNQLKYLTPKTHILKSRGVEIECNGLIPAYYRINEYWYKILPKLTDAKEPTTLHPTSQNTWKYNDPASLATSGIYSEKDLEHLRDRIMFPVEQPALLNEVAREMHGHAISDSEGVISKLLNENTMEKLISNTWKSLWTKFTTFGSISAGILSIFLIIQGIKMIVGIVLRGYALHRAFGWSAHLLSAVWGSLAAFFLSLKMTATPEPEVTPRSIQYPPPYLPEVRYEVVRPPTPDNHQVQLRNTIPTIHGKPTSSREQEVCRIQIQPDPSHRHSAKLEF